MSCQRERRGAQLAGRAHRPGARTGYHRAMRIHHLVALSTLFAGASVAVAQDEPAPPPDEQAPIGDQAAMPAPPPPPMPVAEPPPTKERGILEDANSGRSWLMPTALLPPEGTWSVSDFELFMLGAGYSPADNIQLSATTLLPIVEDMPLWLLLSGKVQLVDSGPFKLAAQGTFTYFSEDSGGETLSTYGGSIGGAATYCLNVDCYSHVTGYLAAAFAKDSSDSAVPFIVGGSAVFKVARRIRLVLEADSAFVLGEINENLDGFLGWYGVRFTSRNIGVDLGFVKPIYFGEGESDDPLVLGLPFVSFTYRGLRGDD